MWPPAGSHRGGRGATPASAQEGRSRVSKESGERARSAALSHRNHADKRYPAAQTAHGQVVAVDVTLNLSSVPFTLGALCRAKQI